MAKEALEDPCEVVEAAGEVAKMLVVDHGTITIMDQAMSKVHRVLSKASNCHGGYVERVAMVATRKGKSLRRHSLKVREEQ